MCTQMVCCVASLSFSFYLFQTVGVSAALVCLREVLLLLLLLLRLLLTWTSARNANTMQRIL